MLIFWIGWNIYLKLFGEKQQDQAKQKKELERKWANHLRNFSPSRLKNRHWKAILGKKKTKTTPRQRKKLKTKYNHDWTSN